MKVLIVGATGFVGKKLVRRCVSEGLEVVSTGRVLEKLDCFAESIRRIYLDILDRGKLKEVFEAERPEIVVHCAALTQSASRASFRRVNVEGTRNVLDASLDAGIRKVIYLSSISTIVGSAARVLTDDTGYAPFGPYGVSKIEAERLAISYRSKGIKIAIFRPTLVYGEDEPHWLPLLTRLLRLHLLPMFGAGDNRYPFVYVENLIDVIMLAMDKEGIFDRTYLVSDAEPVTIKELFCFICKFFNCRPPVHMPRFMALALAHMPFFKRTFRIFTENKTCNIKGLRNDLGYVPRFSFYKGMQRSLTQQERAWLKE